MNWVKPTWGWPADCLKNWSGVSTLHSGTSTVHVPACQPSVACGGSLCGAMMSPRVGDRRRRAERQRDNGERHADQTAKSCSLSHLDLPLGIHIPKTRLPDFM